MAESNLGALKVSLGLDSAQFTQSITDINRRLKGVKSEFEAVNDGTQEYAKSVDGLRAKNDMLNRQMDLQKAKVNELKRKYEESVRVKGADDKATQNLLVRYNKTLGAMNKTESQLKSVNNALSEHTNKTKKAQEGLENFGDKAKSIGGKLSTTLTPAIAGIGIGFLKVADDAEASTVRLQRTFGTTKEEAEELSGVARDLWKKGFGESLPEVENGLIQVKQNIKGLNEGDLEQVTKDAMYLAETFDSDVNEVTRAGNNLMENFGLESEKSFDLMAWGAQNGLNFSQEMFDNLSEFSSMYADMGFSAEEYFSVLKVGTESGIYSLDQMNGVMEEFGLSITDGTKSTDEAMGQMSKSTQKVWGDFQDGKKTVKDVHNAVIKDLSKMDDKTKANQIGVGLYKTRWEELGYDTMVQLGDIEGGLENLDGAMAKSGDAVEKTFGQKATIAWRKAQDELVPLGEKLLVIGEKVLPKVSDAATDMLGWWDELSPAMKDFSLILGGVALVAPPIIMAVGGIASAIGGMMPIIAGITGSIAGAGGLTAGIGGMGGALALLTNPIGLTVGALTGLGLGYIALDKEMDKPIAKSDIFKGKISDSTKAILGDYDKLKTESENYLSGMALGNETITQAHVDKMIGMYTHMTDEILKQLDTRYQKDKAKLVEHFATSDALSAEEEAKILADMDENHTKTREKVEKNNEEKIAIAKSLEGKKGEVVREGNEKINQLEVENNEIMIGASVKNSEEQQTILKNLKDQAGLISLEKALSVSKNAKKEHDETVSEAQKQYNKTVELARYRRDVTGDVTAEQADKLIEEAKRERDGVVTQSSNIYEDTVANAYAKAGENADQANWETYALLTQGERMYNGLLEASNWVKGLFGLKEDEPKGKFKESGRQKISRQKAQFSAPVKRANGTPNGAHSGGMALVGEEGTELAHIPGQGVTMLGVGGQHLIDLPKGSSVLPHRHTKKVMEQYGIPMYADGIGDYFDVFTKGSGAVWDLLKDKFSLENLKPDRAFQESLIGNPLDWAGDFAKDFIKKQWDGFFSSDFGGGNFSGGGADMARKAIAQAIALEGVDYDSWFNPLMTIANKESGFRNDAINLWDINAQRGDPSLGMFQFINSTFKAHSRKGFNDRRNPLHSASAAIRYINSRYGGIQGHPGIRSMAKGGGYKPYAMGGVIDEEQMALMGEDGKREIIIPLERYSARAKELWAQAGMELGLLKAPKPSQYKSVSSTLGTGVTNTNSATNNSYYINVAYTGSTNDEDIATLANQIREQFERIDMRNSRALGEI